MTEIEAWVDEAITRLDLRARKLSPDESTSLIALVQSKYLSTVAGMWWWMDLKVPSVVHDATATTLNKVLPTTEGAGYFVPETEGGVPTVVYQLPLVDVEKLVLECPYFEYSVTSTYLDWLVIESHHNEFFVAKLPHDGADTAPT